MRELGVRCANWASGARNGGSLGTPGDRYSPWSPGEELDKTRAELAQMRHDFARESERSKQSQAELSRRDLAITGLREHIQIKELDMI